MQKNKLAMEIINPEQFASVISYMPNPNELIADRKGFYQTMDDMLLDAKIGSHLRLRKDIVTSFPFVIEQGGASDIVYEFIRDNLAENLNWENDIKEFLTAIEYGFSFSEVLWIQNEQDFFVPDSLRNKRPDQIGFKTDYIKAGAGKKSIWVPLLLKENRPLIENYKFLVYRNNPRAENPYGSSDLLMCYWPWKFKQLGWEFWLHAARKAGVPSLVALFEAPDSQKAQESAAILSETLSEIEGGAGVALANVKEVKTLEMSGALQDHKVLIETCNQEISFALTTQSLSTQEGQYGTRSQATVHDENLVRVCHGDAKALQGVFQSLIDWMVAINFGINEPSPKGAFDLQSYATFQEVMAAIEKKIPVSKEALYTRYALPRPKDAEDSFILPDPVTPSFGLSDSSLASKDKKKSSVRNQTRIF